MIRSQDSTLRPLRQLLRSQVANLHEINEQTAQRLTASSTAPGEMEVAYAALNGKTSASSGQLALRDALRRDGVDPNTIGAIDTLYLRCILGSSSL